MSANTISIIKAGVIVSNPSATVTQKHILKELFLARKDGFISRIDGIIKRSKSGDYYKIVYDPDESSQCSEDIIKAKSKICVEQEDIQEPNLDHFPLLETIHVMFHEHVKYESLEKIAQYIEKKYSCTCVVYPSKKLDVYKF